MVTTLVLCNGFHLCSGFPWARDAQGSMTLWRLSCLHSLQYPHTARSSPLSSTNLWKDGSRPTLRVYTEGMYWWGRAPFWPRLVI